MIPGLQYVPDYLTEDVHDELLRVVDEHAWQVSQDHRVQIYGYNYRHKDRQAVAIGDLPSWSTDLARRLRDDAFAPAVPNMLVVNDYAPGAGIFDHVDQDVFGDVVISVSLGSTCVMHFTRDEPVTRKDLLLAPRSALVLRGEARSAWKHGIAGRTTDHWQGREYIRSRRVSLTFRRV
jgi:alkylated DNA repair dioxygenase AlkB